MSIQNISLNAVKIASCFDYGMGLKLESKLVGGGVASNILNSFY